jgi:aminomethyltransferase
LTRKLCGLEIEGDPITHNEDWWTASSKRGPVGTVRSATYSPRLEKNIALAVLDIDSTTLGSRVEVATPWGARSAAVVDTPFYDPGKALATGA